MDSGTTAASVSTPIASVDEPPLGSVPSATVTNGSNSNSNCNSNGNSNSQIQPSTVTNNVSNATSNGTTLATAVAVDDRTIVVAEPEGEEEQNASNRGNRQQFNFVAVIALGVLSAVVIALGIVLTRNNRSKPVAPTEGGSPSTSISTSTSTSTSTNDLVPENDVDTTTSRREAMISVLEALYEESTGGVDVFDVSSPMKSDDRIAALQWLVEDDPAEVPIPSRNVDDTTADFDEKAYKIRQRYVVVLLYIATNGEHWGEQHNFLSGNDECKWNSNFVQDGSVVENKFNTQGLICNDNGKVTQIPMWWNDMSGTLPHELSFLSETLSTLNIAGGSISGPIPSSFTKLTSLELISVSDNCMSGEIPEGMNPIDLPKLGVFVVHNNNYGLTAHSGSLAGFCDENGGRIDGISAALDCPPEEFDYDIDGDDSNSTSALPAPYGCACCICCYPDKYECQDLTSGGSWTSYFTAELSDNGYPKGFEHQCVSVEQENWIAENCPCVINVTNDPAVQPFVGQCTTDCSDENARPSYDFGS